MSRTVRVGGFELSVGRRRAAPPRSAPSTNTPHGFRLRPVPKVNLKSRADDPKRLVEGLRTAIEQFPALVDGVDLSLPLDQQVAAVTWYHTIELPGGVTTPGSFDHRPVVPHYGLPEDLSGQRVLDIGSWDGFWTFEMERRGGDVTALDIGWLSASDLPRDSRVALEAAGIDVRIGQGFDVAHHALGSKVQRLTGTVYDLDPDVLGQFDLVHLGDVLQHLRDPVLALQQIRRVVRGRAHIVDMYTDDFDALGRGPLFSYQGAYTLNTWWSMSLEALGQIIVDAGFSDVRLQNTYELGRTNQGGFAPHAVWVATP
jgi:tRNA (mo5U34)-methyltransferase